jgi:hypothetical protein
MRNSSTSNNPLADRIIGLIPTLGVVAIGLCLGLAIGRLGTNDDTVVRAALPSAPAPDSRTDTSRSVEDTRGVRADPEAIVVAASVNDLVEDILVSRGPIQDAPELPATGPGDLTPSSPSASETAELPESPPSSEPPGEAGTIQAGPGFTSATLRANPTTSAPSLRLLTNGTSIQRLSGSATSDGFPWVRVQTADGLIGWVVAEAVS